MSASDERRPPHPADGGEADAWLRAALRHAPDAEVAAPPAVSAAILREAVAATGSAAGSATGGATSGATSGARAGVARRSAPPRVLQRLMAAWSWLARPPVAAGFASVMLASVIGLMWWDKPLSEALPARAPEVAVVSALPVAEPRAAAAAAAPRAVLIERVAAPADAAAAPAAPRTAPRQGVPGAVLAKARPATPAAEPEPLRRESTGALADAAPPFDLAETRVPPTSPAPAAAMAAAAAPLAPSAPLPFTTASAKAAGPAAAPAAVTADAAAKLGARSREARPSARVAPPLSLNELRAAIRAEPQRWTWQRGAGAEQPITPALRAWLDRVDDGSAATDTAPASATELRLLRDGQLHTTLTLGVASLRVTPADARRAPQQSALSPAGAAELKTALDAAAP